MRNLIKEKMSDKSIELEIKVKELEKRLEEQHKRSENIYLIVEKYLLDLNLNMRVRSLEIKLNKVDVVNGN